MKWAGSEISDGRWVWGVGGADGGTAVEKERNSEKGQRWEVGKILQRDGGIWCWWCWGHGGEGGNERGRW